MFRQAVVAATLALTLGVSTIAAVPAEATAVAAPAVTAPTVQATSGGGLGCIKDVFVPEGSLVSCVGGWLADLAVGQAERVGKEGFNAAGNFLLNMLGITTENPRLDEIESKLTEIRNQLADQREAIATVQASENNVYSVLTELKLQTEQQAISSLVNRVVSLQGIQEVAANAQIQYLNRLKDLKNSAPTDKATCSSPSTPGSLAQRCYESYTDYQNAVADFNSAYASELGTNLAANRNLHDYLVAGKIGSGTVVTSYAEYLATRDGRAAFLTAEFSDRLAAFYAGIHTAETMATTLKGIYLASQRARTLDPINQAAADKRLGTMLQVEVLDWTEAEIAALPPRIPAGVVVVMEADKALRTTTVGQPMFAMPENASTPDPCQTDSPAAGSGPIDSAWRLQGSSSTTAPPVFTPDINFYTYCKAVPGQYASLADVRTLLSRYNDPLDRATSTTSDLVEPAQLPVGGGFTDWAMPRLSNPTNGSGYGTNHLSEINYLFKNRPTSLGLPADATLALVLGQMSDGYSTKGFSPLTKPGTTNRGRLWLRDEFGVPVWTQTYAQVGTKASTDSFSIGCNIGGQTVSCAGPAGSPAHDWLETSSLTTQDLVATRRQDSKQVLRNPEPVCPGVTACHAELAFRMSREGAVTLATRRTTVDYLKPLVSQGSLCNGVLFQQGNTTALKGANLAGCRIRGLDLRGADLSKANLTGADLTGTSLGGADLTGVTWSNTTCPNGLPNRVDGLFFPIPCSAALTVPRTTVVTSLPLSSSRVRAPYGRTATFLRGALVGAGTGPIARRTVRLFGHRVGARTWSSLGSVVTSHWGTYSHVVSPKASWVYQVRVPAVAGAYRASSSREVRVSVAYRVTSNVRPASSRKVALSGTVSPNARGKRVTLQRLRGATWVNVKSVRLQRNSRYAFVIVKGAAPISYRVVKPAGASLVAGVSRARRA